jgi:hypothetical protein
MHNGKHPHLGRRDEPAPNPLDFVPKNVWRELYQGRWQELTRLQKSKLAVEALFWSLFVVGLGYFNYVRPGHSLTLVLVYAAVAGILLAFFWTLTRFIR